MFPQKQNRKTNHAIYHGEQKGEKREKTLACIFELKFLKTGLIKLRIHSNVSTAPELACNVTLFLSLLFPCLCPYSYQQ